MLPCYYFSSVGKAPVLQAQDRGFEPQHSHFTFLFAYFVYEAYHSTILRISLFLPKLIDFHPFSFENIN